MMVWNKLEKWKNLILHIPKETVQRITELQNGGKIQKDDLVFSIINLHQALFSHAF